MAASAESLRRISAAGLLLRLWQSSLGKKYVMAITGLGLFAFVIIHMLGNLQVYLGPEHINAYAKTLKATPAILWGARLGLLFITILHITAAAKLARANRQARPVAYLHKKPVASTFASRTMIITGLVLFAFIVFHLAHFTLGWIDPQYLEFRDSVDRHDVYRMMVTGFSNPIVSLFYLISMGLLLFHLSHGVSSLFQSLGLRSKKIVGVLDKFARGTALILFLGNISIPLSILAGVIK